MLIFLWIEQKIQTYKIHRSIQCAHIVRTLCICTVQSMLLHTHRVICLMGSSSSRLCVTFTGIVLFQIKTFNLCQDYCLDVCVWIDVDSTFDSFATIGKCNPDLLLRTSRIKIKVTKLQKLFES